MNCIQKALDDLKFRIPKPILEKVFLANNNPSWQRQPVSLDEWILRMVIRPRVLIDANLVGGTEDNVNLSGLESERVDDITTVYRVPKDRTQGRSILSALHISFTDPARISNVASANAVDSSMMLRVGQSMMDAHGSIPMVSSCKVQIIGENVILVKGSILTPGSCFLRCVLGNDENMSHIQLRSYHHFSKLVELAVKSYIFNSYAIDLDQGALSGGQALGRIKEIIDGYSEMEELYQTYLREKWTKVAFMNDNESYQRHIRRLVGGR